MTYLVALVLALCPGLRQPAQEAVAPDPVAPAIDRYRVDAEVSVVGFDGTSTLHDFTGRSRGAQGELRFAAAHPAAAAGGQVWVEAKTLDTRNDKRDKTMRSTLEVERYPHIRFTLDSLTGTMAARRGELAATGRFDIHGVTRQRVVPLTITPDGELGIRVRGESRFDISDHGVDTPSVLFVSMHDEVRAWLDLTLLPVESPSTSATSRALTVLETGPGVTAAKRTERIWETPAGLLWERANEAEWIVVRDDGTFLVDMRRGLRTAAPLPAGEPAEVVTAGALVTVRLGETSWVELEGLAGEAPFAGALLLLPDLPAPVRRSLGALRGIPRVVRVRRAAADGAEAGQLEVRLGPAEEGRLRAWALRPEDWTDAAAPAPPARTEAAVAR